MKTMSRVTASGALCEEAGIAGMDPMW